MRSFPTRRWIFISCLLVLGVLIFVGLRPDPGDLRLRDFVHELPPVPIIFTSRTEPLSLVPAAPTGEGFTAPGQSLWAAREGRLRLLNPSGTVHELTWNNPLPDGGHIIDVMSPSVSPNGTKVVFAGRLASPDAGRFRIFEVGLNGLDLRQITGGSDDPGCTALPPLRYAEDGSRKLSDADRRRLDYDDVDPIYLNLPGYPIVFVSSRAPDLGRNHARRSTTLWRMNGDGSQKQPITFNRNNDRWPVLLTSNHIAFSLWSRNQEVVSADRTRLEPYQEGETFATASTNTWMAAFVSALGAQFGMLAKPTVPVWRPRPLFNGRLVFMTPLSTARDPSEQGPLTIMQVDPGLVQTALSARPVNHASPTSNPNLLHLGPAKNEGGQRWSLATPSPCPAKQIVLAGCACNADDSLPAPARYGIYLIEEDWPEKEPNPPMRLVFDDPELVDAEPVAVYRRDIPYLENLTEAPPGPLQNGPDLALAGGGIFKGPQGTIFNPQLYLRFMDELPGQKSDLGEGPLFGPPPKDTLHTIVVYGSFRDRFDDPEKPRVPGEWKLLAKSPVREGAFHARLPAATALVLAGLDAEGKLAEWSTSAQDSQGRSGKFYALAGDHYSGIRPGEAPLCIGCHPGHSTLAPKNQDHAERIERR